MGVQLKSFRTYLEESTKEVVVTFGRFNPPTIGHEKLFKKLVATAGKIHLEYTLLNQLILKKTLLNMKTK